MADRLTAWLHDTPVAALTAGPEFRIQLQWRDEGIERWGLGSPALSVGLPIGAATGRRGMRGLDFFENMLPEGPALARMAALANVRSVDTYGILRAFGHRWPASSARHCSAAPPTEPGRAPAGDAPSTWILKPDGRHPMAANEATCMGLAAACGLAVPDAELIDVAGLPVVAVRRYDRQDPLGGGMPVRLHQEDGCQATATPPGLKYEEQGGPSLRDLASLLRNFGDPHEVTSLLSRTTFNMAVGNADAHAKNFSVLHEPDGPAIRLAPLYDVLSTMALELTDDAGQPLRADTHLGQRVGGQADIRKVTAADLADEAVSWGIRRRAASAVVTETLDRVVSAIPAMPGEARVLAAIREQAERIGRS